MDRLSPAKKVLILVLCALLLLTQTACGAAKAGKAFVTALPREILSLDPQAAWGASAQTVLREIFEGLCRVGEDGKAVPGVASRWETQENGTRYVFHLRKAFWSDGEPVTAQDFLFGIRRALRPETKATAVQDLFLIKNARAVYQGQLPEDALGITVRDDRTLVIDLEVPFPDFPLLTAGSHYMPCREDFFDASVGHYGLSGEYLLTNGPFTFASIYAWDSDYGERSITLVPSDTYRGERDAEPASVQYLIDYDDAVDADPLFALQAGTVDLLEVSRSLAQEAELRDLPVLSQENATIGLLLNPACEALQDLQVRRLFLQTLDRADLLQRGQDLGPAAQGIFPATVLWSGHRYYDAGDAAYPPADPTVVEGLSALLEQKDWDRLPGITVLCPDDEASVAVVTGMLIAWNAVLGNAFNMLPLPEEELNARVAAGDYEAALFAFRPHAATVFGAFAAFGWGQAELLPEEWDYAAQLNALTFDKAACQALEQQLAQQYVFYPLFSGQTFYALSPKSRRITLSPEGTVEFGKARKVS